MVIDELIESKSFSKKSAPQSLESHLPKQEIKKPYTLKKYQKDLEICYYATFIGALALIPVFHLSLLFSN